MTQAVFDASAIVARLLDEPGSERVAQLYAEHDVHAPDRLDEECANAIWKRFIREEIDGEQAAARMEALARYEIHRHDYGPLLEIAFALAMELRRSVHDCMYILLALSGRRVLVTADAKMREAAEAVGVRVEWVGAG